MLNLSDQNPFQNSGFYTINYMKKNTKKKEKATVQRTMRERDRERSRLQWWDLTSMKR